MDDGSAVGTVPPCPLTIMSQGSGMAGAARSESPVGNRFRKLPCARIIQAFWDLKDTARVLLVPDADDFGDEAWWSSNRAFSR
ncbi:hypothetical protein NDU88_000337 [Pleurodeles waltl]|uniref:Uncharacterized protein n=1 Tax=Pleurodeles waltl TaxID=8319 RepID=A0AAV7L7V7_PLEWA|nr:hypothetical protein NDU88_000337 [Pleurodeles waltl]